MDFGGSFSVAALRRRQSRGATPRPRSQTLLGAFQLLPPHRILNCDFAPPTPFFHWVKVWELPNFAPPGPFDPPPQGWPKYQLQKKNIQIKKGTQGKTSVLFFSRRRNFLFGAKISKIYPKKSKKMKNKISKKNIIQKKRYPKEKNTQKNSRTIYRSSFWGSFCWGAAAGPRNFILPSTRVRALHPLWRRTQESLWVPDVVTSGYSHDSPSTIVSPQDLFHKKKKRRRRSHVFRACGAKNPSSII